MPKPPCGIAPLPASAALTLLSRSGMRLAAWTVVATALATLFAVNPVSAGPMEDRAVAAAQASRAKSADSKALTTHYLAPGLSGQPISTIDNSHSFTPSLGCQATTSLLEVLVQPAATGDLGRVQIGRDLDLDGTIETVSTLPMPVSGICANGIISCQPGTWTQCHYLRWAIDTAAALELVEVEMPALGGCYCLNNSCGSNLAFTNLAAVLGDLGGGMVGALTSNDPRVGVAQALIDGPMIRYVGALSTACAVDPSVTQTRYRADPVAMAGDAVVRSSGNSVFEALKGSAIGLGQAQEIRRCTIERQVAVNGATIDDIITRVAGGYATIKAGHDVDFLMGSPTDNSLSGGSCRLFDFKMTLRIDDPSRILNAHLSHFFADDWAQVRVDGTLIASGPTPWASTALPPGPCERHATFHANPDVDLKPWLTRGEHEIWLRIAVGDGGEGMAQIHVALDDGCKMIETMIDGCSALASVPACLIKDERSDDVETFRNGIKTGLDPLPQTRILGTAACPVTLTRDFFVKDRSYRCEIETGTLPTPDLSRARYIIAHSTPILLADRLTDRNGETEDSTRGFAMPAQRPVAACEPICKSRSLRHNIDAAPAGVVGARQNSPTGIDTHYHACTQESVCPLGPGEELVSACGCLDDFPEAVMMMQTVRLAGADLVCTGTVR